MRQMTVMAWSTLRIETLGELRVLHDGAEVALPASRKTRALLGYLALTGREHHRDRICELLWESADDPRAQLRWSLWKLRELVDGPARHLVSTRDRVGLDVRGTAIDAAIVRGAVAAGIDATPTQVLRDVAERFRGDLLEGIELSDCFRFAAWCVAEREAMRQLRSSVLTELVRREHGDPELALRYARTRVEIDPLNEAAHVDVIQLLAGLGRARDALRQYEVIAKILETELRTAPSLELERARMAVSRTTVPVAASAIPAPAITVRAAAPLVGRDAERSRLAALLDAPGGDPVLISGEPGIGKTRLIDELLALAATRGVIVATGRAFETERIRPYGAWLDALRAPAVQRHAGPLPEELAPLLPELAAPRVADGGGRDRMFEAIAALLGRLVGTDRRAIVVLDDVHWLDESSAALVHFIVRSRIPRLLLVLAVRTGELHDNAAAYQLVRALRQSGIAELALVPLDVAAVAELARAIDPAADPSHVVAASDGNPLFAIELARTATRDHVPASLTELLADRLDRLDERASRVVTWAAVIGRSFDIAVLARVATLPIAELVEAIEELERRVIVRPIAGERYDFVHDLVRRAAYARVSGPRKRLCHGEIARALDERADRELAGEVALHAGLASDHALAARACVTAGWHCIDVFAHREARAFVERGRHHAAQLPVASRAALELELACIAAPTRGPTEWATTSDQLLQLIAATPREHADVIARACHTLAIIKRASDEVGARAVLVRGADAEGITPAVKLQMLAVRSRCHVMLGEPREAREALSGADAVAQAHALRDPELDIARGLLAFYEGELEHASHAFERVLPELARGTDHWRECDCLWHLAMVALEIGDLDEAERRARELEQVAPKLGADTFEAAIADGLLALVAIRSNARDGGARLAHALDRLRAIDAKSMQRYVLLGVAEHALHAGELERAAEHAALALALAREVRIATDTAAAAAILASVAARRGEHGAARDQLAAARDALALGQASARARELVEDATDELGRAKVAR